MFQKKFKVMIAVLLCAVLLQGSLVKAATLTTYEDNIVIPGYSTLQTTFTATTSTLYVNAKLHQGTQGFTLKIEGVDVSYSSSAYFPYYITRPDAVFNLQSGQKYKISVSTDGSTSVYTTITFKY